jgi:uncharacterized protein (TIGR00725 family)
VIGYDEQICTEAARNAAFEVGRELAKAGAVLICGGLGGVMEAACRGAREEGGLTIGIIPSDDTSQANKYCDVVIATGAGFMRDFFIIHSADAVIVIGGGAGTLIELSAAYHKSKTLISVTGTGGIADKFANQYIDERRKVKVIAGNSPSDSVKKALKEIG